MLTAAVSLNRALKRIKMMLRKMVLQARTRITVQPLKLNVSLKLVKMVVKMMVLLQKQARRSINRLSALHMRTPRRIV